MIGSSLFDKCLRAIEKWNPKKYSKELDYKNALRDFLSEELNKLNTLDFGNKTRVYVKKEPKNRSYCDLSINRQIGVELKFGKEGKISRKQINELQGQVLGHIREYPGGVIVILVGKVDKESEENVELELNRIHLLFSQNDFGINQYHLKLRNKSTNKKSLRKNNNSIEFNFKSLLR